MIVALTVSLFPCSGIENEKEINLKDENSNKRIDLLNKNDFEGTFFKAIGQETLQSISIGKKGIVYTSTKPNQKIVFPYVEPKNEGEGKVYKTETKNEEIEIVIYKDETSHEFMDGRFDHSVAVRLVRNKETKEIINDFACLGYYLYDNAISGNWIFQTFENKKVEELNIFQIPMICIDVNTRSFSGSGGNHMVYGNITCEGDYIKFEIKMAPKYSTNQYMKEKELLFVLENCNKFIVKDNHLFLYEDDVLKLSFIKDVF